MCVDSHFLPYFFITVHFLSHILCLLHVLLCVDAVLAIWWQHIC